MQGAIYDHVVPPHEGVPGDGAPCGDGIHTPPGRKNRCREFGALACPYVGAYRRGHFLWLILQNLATADFRRLGLRVAAMLLSPWVAKGAVVQEPQHGPTNTSQWEHSSISATLTGLFNLTSYLTKRDEWAGSFEQLLLDSPRTDAPAHLPEAPAAQHQLPAREEARGSSGAGASARRMEEVAHLDPGRAEQAPARHCSATEPTCRGSELMSVKQQRSMWVMAQRTDTALPSDMESMTMHDADAWLRARWTEFAGSEGAL